MKKNFKINPIYKIEYNEFGENKLYSVLEKKYLLKWVMKDSLPIYINSPTNYKILKSIEEYCNIKLILNSNSELHLVKKILNVIEKLPEESKQILSDRLPEYMKKIRIDIINVKNNIKSRTIYFPINNTGESENLCLVYVDSEIIDEKKLYKHLKKYSYVYFVQELHDQTYLGPFLNNFHLNIENIRTIMRRKNITFSDYNERLFVENSKEYINDIAVEVLLEISSEYVLGESLLHNRQIEIINNYASLSDIIPLY